MDLNSYNLFSKKELYRMAHDCNGNSYLIKSIPTTKRRKIVDDNMHLMNDMEFDNGYPILKPYNGTIDLNPVPYTERISNPSNKDILHFFLDDYKFRDAVWHNLDHTTYVISLYDYVFTPDLSLWCNLKTEYFNKKNTFRTRFIGAYWQNCGFNVIPTASWGGLESFSYCFSGLPRKSVIGVSAMGARKNSNAFNLWCNGIKRLIKEKEPSLILIYGDKFEIPEVDNSIFKFLPTFISKHFRNGTKNK